MTCFLIQVLGQVYEHCNYKIKART